MRRVYLTEITYGVPKVLAYRAGVAIGLLLILGLPLPIGRGMS